MPGLLDCRPDKASATISGYRVMRIFLLPFLVALAVTSGCMSPAINDSARVGPFYVPRNVQKDITLGGIRRVVLLPVWSGSAAPEESAESLDPVFRQALQDQNRFEVVTLSREECRRRFGVSALSSAASLPYDFIPTIQRVFAADAVMFVDITVYRPYHPLALGVRGRLAAVNNLRIVWSFDNVFSADDPAVAASARHFYLHSELQGEPADLTPAALQSPGRFAAYVASATFTTLPPVAVPKLTESSNVQR